jgi:signal transduction histidine kinase
MTVAVTQEAVTAADAPASNEEGKVVCGIIKTPGSRRCNGGGASGRPVPRVTVREALSRVLEKAAESAGAERALVVFRQGEEYAAVGVGHTAREIRAVTDAAGGDHVAFGDAIRSGKRRRVVAPADLGEIVVFPVSGADAEFSLVVDGGTDESDLERLAQEFASHAAGLDQRRQFSALQPRNARLAEERELLVGIMDALPDPVLLTDRDDGIVVANARAAHLFSEVEGEGEDRRRIARENTVRLGSFLAGSQPRRDQPGPRELALVDPSDGSDLRFEARLATVARKGADDGRLWILRHLTGRTRTDARDEREERDAGHERDERDERAAPGGGRARVATAELVERDRRPGWQGLELEEASRMKSEFLASMSHELRTPINAVMGYTALLREEIYGELTDKQKGGLEKINAASRHLLDLINDILDLSKIEAGRMPVHLEEVSLREIIVNLGDAVRPRAEEKGLDLAVNIDPALPDLFTDRTKLKQILLNLLSNAVKFTSEGGVTLEASPADGDRVRLVVADTGIGIEAEDLETIFDDFRQVDQSPTREYGGTGLGLSITRKLVALLDGDIAVDSTSGVGTTFEVEMPIRLDPGTRQQQLGRALS